MKRSFLTLLFLASGINALTAGPALGQARVSEMFDKLKSLAGDWQAKGPNGLIMVSYRIVSGGTAVMETRTPPNEPSMITVFHVDHQRLVLTHFCSVGNQPRMIAQAFASGVERLSFSFLDATNLASPSEGHMRGLTFTFLDQDHVTQVWTWRRDGTDIPMHFNLERRK